MKSHSTWNHRIRGSSTYSNHAPSDPQLNVLGAKILNASILNAFLADWANILMCFICYFVSPDREPVRERSSAAAQERRGSRPEERSYPGPAAVPEGTREARIPGAPPAMVPQAQTARQEQYGVLCDGQ